MKKLTPSNYKKDSLYPSVARAMAEILKAKGYVAPVDLLLHLGRITSKQYEDWRFGRVDYLERVCTGSLGRLSRLLRILELHARSLQLTPSQTVYRKWGRGGKRIALRFSKSGTERLEAAYARHYVTRQGLKDRQKAARPATATSAERPVKEPSARPGGDL